jgi:DNA-binding response OmpR family regulator
MKILVVEDEHRIANTVKEGLEQEHHTVDVTYDGQSGYDFAATEDYDLIILDRMLPQMDGIEVCQQLRQQHIHTPILMLTAKSQTTDKITGLDAGADDYLTKPFSFGELLARIRAIARRPRQTLNQQITIKDLTLDPQTYQVTRLNQPIKLTNKEYALLEYLMRNPNRVLKKSQIIDHLWNYEADILPNTVEVYIKILRDKIDKSFPNLPNLIHTIRGFGYKFG